MPLAARFFSASPWSQVAPFDADGMRSGLSNILAADHAAIFVTVSPIGAISGACGCIVCPSWIAPKMMVAQELFWWVEPDASRDALKVWAATEAWAHEAGADIFVMVRIEGMRNDQLHRLYERRGYNAIEHTYVRPLRQGQWPASQQDSSSGA